jgi:uncharacterized delta-60 repeat protein
MVTARPPGSTSSYASSAQSGGGGKIVIGGTAASGETSNDFMVARFRSDGRLDPSFGGDGIATRSAHANDFGNDIAILASGKVVVAGSTIPTGSPPNTALLRFNAAGGFDSGFGMREADFGGNDQLYDLSVDGLGRLVAAGFWDGSMAVFRFDAMGHQELGFGSEGGIGIEFPAPFDAYSTGYAILTPGAKIVVVGTARIDGTTFGFAMARRLA